MSAKELTAVNFEVAETALPRGSSEKFIHALPALPHDGAKGGVA